MANIDECRVVGRRVGGERSKMGEEVETGGDIYVVDNLDGNRNKE